MSFPGWTEDDKTRTAFFVQSFRRFMFARREANRFKFSLRIEPRTFGSNTFETRRNGVSGVLLISLFSATSSVLRGLHVAEGFFSNRAGPISEGNSSTRAVVRAKKTRPDLSLEIWPVIVTAQAAIY
jgi:hypothetical protein